jgi:threonyl-tRNA synthetase
MLPIFYLKPEFENYANNIKNLLEPYGIYVQTFLIEVQSLNKIIRTNPQSYKIIIGHFEVENNSICIRKNLGNLENILINQIENYIHNFIN